MGKIGSALRRWGCLVCVLGLCPAVSCQQKEGPPPGAPPPTPVLAAKALLKPMPVTIEAIGTVEASRAVSVYSRIDGTLVKVHFREGADVEEGQVLFTLDRAPFEEKLRQVEARLAKDLAQLAYQQEESQRYASLLAKGAVSRSEADKVRTEASATEALVRADRAEVAEARLNLGYCSIDAPFAGRTGVHHVHAGAIVRAKETALTSIHRIDPARVRFSIPEQRLADVRRFSAKGALGVRIGPAEEPAAGRLGAGRLVFVDNAVDAASGMILLKAEFANKDRRLWPGQFVRVFLELARPSVVVVPLRAVQTGDKGAFLYVVKPDATVDIRPVVVERSAGEEAVIGKGAAAGETVITDGHLKVWPGARVEIRDSLAAAARPDGPAGGAKR